jgi:Tfp pilus assembly protein PilV
MRNGKFSFSQLATVLLYDKNIASKRKQDNRLKIKITTRKIAGLTLPEVMMAVAITMTVAGSVFAVIVEGFRTSAATQQNLRATQILDEQMEVIRLYTWDQLTTSGFVPTTFTAPYYTNAMMNTPSFNYNGTVSITEAGLTTEAYTNDMKAVTVTLNWKCGTISETRSMKTLVSRYGLHNYYYHYN